MSCGSSLFFILSKTLTKSVGSIVFASTPILANSGVIFLNSFLIISELPAAKAFIVFGSCNAAPLIILVILMLFSALFPPAASAIVSK